MFSRIKKFMDELAPPKMARALDRQAMANDAAALRALAAQANSALKAEIEKKLPPNAKIDLGDPDAPTPVTDRRGATVMSSDPVMESVQVAIPVATGATPNAPSSAPVVSTHVTISPSPQPVSAAPVIAAARNPSRLILFTGRPKSGKTFLAAQLGAISIDLREAVRDLARGMFFPGDLADKHPEAFESFCRRFRAWGAGIVSESVPMDTTRLLVMRSVSVPKFGTPTFWASIALGIVKEDPVIRYCIEGVETAAEHKMLTEAGFRPYHVMAGQLTISSRGGMPLPSDLTTGLDNDVLRKIASQPHGKKLWCVWNDPSYPSPSPRLLSMNEFLESVV